MEIHVIPPDQLARFIDRIRKLDAERYEAYLHSLMVNVLTELGEFVPSEGALVLLDDPTQKKAAAHENELTYVAAFGPGCPQLIGKKIPTTAGIIGETYVLSKSMVRKAGPREKIVLDRAHLHHPINTLITVPLKIENSVIGVLAILNKKDPVGFTIRDLKLAEIFSGYISTSVQNAIDARKSQELSKRDDLTGLFNDRYFHRQLETEIRLAADSGKPLCLVFLDLDNFKSINDQYGHLVGSQTLKEVGFVLRECVQTPPATLARYGGDEYVIILPGTALEEAVEIGDAIRKGISGKLFMIDHGEQDGAFINFKGVISASIGISSLHDHVGAGLTPREKKNQLIKSADRAMYDAKDGGKNRVCVARTG